MDNSYDREKVIDCMFDPITSEIIAELEDGQKDSKYLAEKSSDRKSTRLNSSHSQQSRMPSSA